MPGSVPPPSVTVPDDDTVSPAAVTGPAHRLRVTLLMAGSCPPILGAVLIAPVLPKMKDHFDSVPGAKGLVPLALTVPALSLALLALGRTATPWGAGTSALLTSTRPPPPPPSP